MGALCVGIGKGPEARSCPVRSRKCQAATVAKEAQVCLSRKLMWVHTRLGNVERSLAFFLVELAALEVFEQKDLIRPFNTSHCC